MTQLPPFIRDPAQLPANVLDVMPAIIGKIASEIVWPPTPKAGEVVQLKRRVA
ncbi:hypothetical protein A4U53_010910 [Rhizobium ruizarguesonis]|uniref:Uncharacterized protein n=1 Tax=Rhizobium ruizarguesonis TaxID=2081791 RepID=A0ACD5EQJ3_9HYPH|nr:hypothetical protein [Rhizobium leguminosarum]